MLLVLSSLFSVDKKMLLVLRTGRSQPICANCVCVLPYEKSVIGDIDCDRYFLSPLSLLQVGGGFYCYIIPTN